MSAKDIKVARKTVHGALIDISLMTAEPGAHIYSHQPLLLLSFIITSIREMEVKFAIPSLSLALCLRSGLFNCGHAALDRK